MVNERMHALGAEPSAIRELFAYGLARKAEIGEENVFDFSIGNPSVPAPDAIKQAVIDLMEEPACALHGYSPAAGDPRARQAVASHIRRHFGIDASPDQVYLTAGAAAGLAISISAITRPGDEVIVIAPYFPEYKVWIETAECTCVEVPAHVPDFQLDVEAIEAAITPKTSAVIINSPNNPVGAVYTRENLEAFAAMLSRKERELGRKLYVISDEPYREIVYGKEVPYVPCIYPRTIVCYSYSKSLSLPGERIGYIYVSDLADDAREVSAAVAGAGRALGIHLRAGAVPARHRAVHRGTQRRGGLCGEPRAADRRVWAGWATSSWNPTGRFYLWVRALEDDRAGVLRPREGARAAAGALGQLRRGGLGARELLHPARDHRAQHAGVRGAHEGVPRVAPAPAPCTQDAACLALLFPVRPASRSAWPGCVHMPRGR